MKILLTAINAKYIHSNLGLYSLKAYAEKHLTHLGLSQMSQIGIDEYTINHSMEFVLREIYKKKPEFIGISCYIWNIRYVIDLVSDLHKLLPDCAIWLGGPEVTYQAEQMLTKCPGVQGVIRGEGEKTFACLCQQYTQEKLQLDTLAGITYRNHNGEIVANADQPVILMDEIPFVYQDLREFEHRIVYYESSRGCPFACSYCLSSVEKSVRFRSLELVKQELAFFLNQQVPQVKFVDRTFNCKKEHVQEIWKYILQHDNGITNFHFEVSADLLDEAELDLIEQMRPGLIQLEIGVQSTNPKTIKEIRRRMDLTKLAQVVARINQFQNVHQHLDLIAGLPYENFERFQESFNEVYAMRPEQLQLGFLKVLKGSYMETMAGQYQLNYQSSPVYEVLSTKWLSYDELIELKMVEEILEVYYNSGQFRITLARLELEFASPFLMFWEIARFYEGNGLFGISHSRLKRYEILHDFLIKCNRWKSEYDDCLIQDLYVRENMKSRPSFGIDQTAFKKEIKEFFINEAQNPLYLSGYQAYDSRQLSKMVHIEVLQDGRWMLFDYLNRDALLGNAKMIMVKTG